MRSDLVTFAAEHDLTDAVRISNTTRFGHATRDSIYSSPRFLNTTSTLITPQTQSRDTVDEILLNQSNVFAKFATGSLRHDLIAGFEVSREKSRNQLRNITAGTPTDLFNPDPERPWVGVVEDIPGAVVRARADTVAAYLFDTINLSEQLLVTGGLRWEHYKSRFAAAAAGRAARPHRPQPHLASRRHLQACPPLKPLCRGRDFGESVDREYDADYADRGGGGTEARAQPHLSKSAPSGMASRANYCSARRAFRTTKMNARTPGLPGEPATVLEGKQRVDGFEFGATGRITQRVGRDRQLHLSRQRDCRARTTATEIGNRLPNVPVHSGSLWTTYKLPVGRRGRRRRPLRRRARYTNVANVRRVEAYFVADATVGYEFARDFTLRLNAFNLFDKRYADQISGGHFVPGPGRSVLATLSIRR